jgi:hypothetical protein
MARASRWEIRGKSDFMPFSLGPLVVGFENVRFGSKAVIGGG